MIICAWTLLLSGNFQVFRNPKWKLLGLSYNPILGKLLPVNWGCRNTDIDASIFIGENVPASETMARQLFEILVEHITSNSNVNWLHIIY